MHADLAAEHDAGIGFAHNLKARRSAGFSRIRSRSSGRRRKTSETARSRRSSHGNGAALATCSADTPAPRRGEDAERDHVAIGWGVGDVAGGQKGRGRKEPAHAAEVVGALGAT